jgi:hypothetical protein
MSVILSQVMEMETESEKNQETAQEVAPAEDFSSELNEPSWSVITYKSVAVSHLTYQEAQQWAEDLKKQGVSGICVITDEAAARVGD